MAKTILREKTTMYNHDSRLKINQQRLEDGQSL